MNENFKEAICSESQQLHGAQHRSAGTLTSNQTQPKHTRLDKEIDSMGLVRGKASALLDRIQNNPKNNEKISENIKPELSLQEVLNSGADRINEANSKLFGVLNSIESALFD